jgi:predicted Zn-dependent peptidase
MEQAELAINEEIKNIQSELVSVDELTKVKNKSEATHTFGEVDILSKATNLAISELLGNADIINREVEKYLAVTAEQIKEQANKLLIPENCSTLYYKSKKK